ncbi:MAG: SDR family oxidoreductase [Myxococcota bacterium]|nr:SDR family oxidoreductase [Myxococcota bacterium]
MSIFRDDILAGKTAFVTGGGSGICKGITRALMQHGCDAVIVSRNQDRLDGAAVELSEETGRTCVGMACDVRHVEQVNEVIESAVERFGKFDIIVNGAAGNFLSPAAMLSPKGFRTVMEIDTQGTYNVTRAAFDHTLQAHGGHILNVSATLHYTGVPLQTHAGAAKAAIDAMTRHLAVEWGPLGIRVNCIAPGPIDDTEGMSRLAPGGTKAKIEATIPLKRFGRIDEIGDAAVFLCSDAATYITGEVLVVDGGAWMTFGGAIHSIWS